MTSLKSQEKNAKVVFALDSPFPELSSPQWPQIPPEILQSIDDLLYSFLSENPTPLLTGPNSITSHLESLSRSTIPTTLPSHIPSSSTPRKQIKLLAVFVSRLDSQPSLLHAHIPTLCAITNTRLIQLPKGAEGRLCKALKKERVGFVGVFEGTVGSEVLCASIKEENVGVVKRPEWLGGGDGGDSGKAVFRGLQVKSSGGKNG